MFYLFKIERCDAINLLSKHETFEDALRTKTTTTF